MKPFIIHVLDDNKFFLHIFKQRIQQHANTLAGVYGFEVTVKPFSDYLDFLRNMKRDVDLTFLDFYLGNGINAASLLSDIKRYGVKGKIAMISELQNLEFLAGRLQGHIDQFLRKDDYLVQKACLLLDATLAEQGYLPKE